MAHELIKKVLVLFYKCFNTVNYNFDNNFPLTALEKTNETDIISDERPGMKIIIRA